MKQLHKLAIASNLIGMYYPLELEKSLIQIEFDNFLEKGKGAQVGEIRTWGGEQYVKHIDGWIHIHKKTGKVSVLPTSGEVRKLDGTDDHKVHYENHIKGKSEGSISTSEDIKPMSRVHFEHKGKILTGTTGKYHSLNHTHEIHVEGHENNGVSGVYHKPTENLQKGYPKDHPNQSSETSKLREDHNSALKQLKTEEIGSDSYRDLKNKISGLKEKLADPEEMDFKGGTIKHLGPISEHEDQYEVTHGPTGKSKAVFKVTSNKSNVGGQRYDRHDVMKTSGGNSLSFDESQQIKNKIINHRKKIVERDQINFD